MPPRDGAAPHKGVSDRYDALVARGTIRDDAAQRRALASLDRLENALAARQLARKGSALGWLFAARHRSPAPIRGVYLVGGVGRGKTMLMDLFYETVPGRDKRRVHFNAFMADVHDRIGKHRQARRDGLTQEDDPIPPVARAIAAECRLICFDEFAVTDIADAMVLSRLFTTLFEAGVVLVATSNVAPEDLYRDGLNRALFLPFVALLQEHCEVVALDGGADYRLEKLKGMPVYLSSLSPETDRLMDDAWRAASGGKARRETLTVLGHAVEVPSATKTCARFAFADLCERPLGARDYLALADRFATLFIDRVPVMDQSRRNEAKRFILLIDTLYDRHARLFVSAAAPPAQLYAGTIGTEAFEFHRTASRLVEMQGGDWLSAWEARNRLPV